MIRPGRVAIYADVDVNLVDGSSIWLTSLVEVIAGLDNIEVDVLLKASTERDLLLRPLRAFSNVRLVEPQEVSALRRLGPSAAADALGILDAERHYHALIVRGNAVVELLCGNDNYRNRLWPYYIPPANSVDKVGDPLLGRLGSSRFVLCQTEAVRAFVEAYAPELADKTALLPPMIPDPVPWALAVASKPRLIYVGKLDPRFRLVEAIEVFSNLRRIIPDLEFHVVGDKFHDPGKTGFGELLRAALTKTSGVVWHRALSRAAAVDLMRGARVAWALRDGSLANSLEVSTKLLEYGSAGVPPLADGTDRNRETLGEDYPLFADDRARAYELAKSMFEDDDLHRVARDKASKAASAFTFSAARERIRPYLARARPPELTTQRGAPRILVAGHDLKFIKGILQHLETSGARIAVDQWAGQDAHDERRSRDLLKGADLIICEWCLGNALWYSRHKERNQKLVVRLHRVELETRYPKQIESANVDAFVVVSPHIARAVVSNFGWPGEKVAVVGNWVEVYGLARPKLPGSKFSLGVLGYLPQLKRLDRALDLLETLRRQDTRFHLYLKGSAPWELGWVWRRQRDYFMTQFQRIQSSPLLCKAVTREPFDARVGSWFRKVGYIVSFSDIEGNQVAVAEGAATGAIPLVLPRPGANDLYPATWIHASTDAAAARVLELTEEGRWELESARTAAFARDAFSYERVGKSWTELLDRVLRTDSPAPETSGDAALGALRKLLRR